MMIATTIQEQPQQQEKGMIKLRGNMSAFGRLFNKESKHRRSHSQQYNPVSQRIQEEPKQPTVPQTNNKSKKSQHKRSKSAPIKSSKLNNGNVFEVTGISVQPSSSDIEMTDCVEVTTRQLMIKGILKSTSTINSITAEKQFRFNEIVLVGEAHSRDEYERKSDFQLQLTPALAYMIKRELNEFKSGEMEVHEESRGNTQIYRV